MKIKQHNLGTKFGAIRFLASRTMIYMSVYSLFALSAAAIPTIGVWFPWINFPILIGIVVAFFLVAMVLDHLFVYKAEIDYTTKQAYIDENPAAKALKKVERGVAENSEKIDKILEILNIGNTTRS